MSIYVRNRACRCPRCKARGVFGGAILVTLGILFLLDEYGGPDFDQTWPVLLIVFGLLSLARRGVERTPPPPPRPSWIQPPPGSAANYRQSSYPDAGTRPPDGGEPK